MYDDALTCDIRTFPSLKFLDSFVMNWAAGPGLTAPVPAASFAMSLPPLTLVTAHCPPTGFYSSIRRPAPRRVISAAQRYRQPGQVIRESSAAQPNVPPEGPSSPVNAYGILAFSLEGHP